MSFVHDEIAIVVLEDRFGCGFPARKSITGFVGNILHSKNFEVATVIQSFSNVLITKFRELRIVLR